jgi:peroxiredoxin
VIQEDPALAKDVKIIGIAVGNSKKDADAIKSKFQVPFPIFPDQNAELWTAFGKPGTPTMVLTTNRGKVLMSHEGLINNFETLLKEIREIHEKQ